MEILPAIDLRAGKVVRLAQGDYGRQTTYSDQPDQVARAFESAGAGWIHVVDLDAARSGRRTNADAVRGVRKAVKCRIELGGGARDAAAIDAMLADGADRVVVGSAALADWPWFEKLLSDANLAPKLALGLDAREGDLAARGWTAATGLKATDLAARVRGSRLGAIVYTDIARDGLLGGVNIEATAAVIAATDVPVIASGGVASIEDIRRCRRIGCGGAIVGKAYYEGKIELKEAIACATGEETWQ